MTNWTEEQKQAIKKRNSNILVSASAGSGKTAVLVERIIEKVVNEYLDIDKILVVTFTNAAAQELKEKILNAIYKALENETDSKKRNHLKNQLIYINRASITTIDAFCFKLVKENFNELEIDPNIRICEESQSILIKTRILEELLEKEYESAPESKDIFGLYNILELFNGKDEDFLANVLKIYNYIQAFTRPFEWLKEQIEKYNIDENLDLVNTDFGRDIFNEIIDDLKLCILKCEEIENKIQSREDFIKHFELIEDDLNQIKRCIIQEDNTWDKLYNNINSITFSSFPRNKVSDVELKDEIKEIRDKEVKAVIEKCKKKIYATSNEILEDNRIAYKYMSYLYDFILSFDTAFRKEKKDLSIAEFNDIMHYALDLVLDNEGNPTPIAESLRDRFKEIYTDEYQDTSYVQEALLQAISRDNNRFMVGDIKQSIYGFRQARPDIFNEKYIAYKRNDECSDEDKEAKIILAQNFRSREEVIDSINYIFEKIMSMRNGECNYTDDETLKCGNKSYISSDDTSFKTEIDIINLKEQEALPMIDDEQSEDDEYEIDENLSNVQIEAKCIAYKIQDIVSNVKVMGKDGALRKATYKDIVILIRSVKNKAQVYEEILKEQNIPVFADTSASIFEGDETKLILSFLRILDNPYQDIYLISIMYSIIGNFTLDDIARIRLYNSKEYVYDTLLAILEDEDFKEKYVDIYEKTEKFVKLIEEYTRYSKIFSISDLLVRLYKDTNIYYQFAIEESGASKKANLDYLIELANTFVSQIGNTLNSYIRYVDNLKDKQDGSSSAKIIGENEDVVRIMTIHKSKGLEFPIVILADTAKKYNLSDVYKEKVQMHHKYGVGIDIVNQDYGVTYPSVIKQAVKSVIEKDLKSEEIRLLYVALTRAKEKLYIFATTKDYDKDYDKQSINVREGKFNEAMIASNDSYYKHLLPVIKWYNEYETENKVLNVVKIDVKSDTTEDNLKELLGVKEQDEKRYSMTDLIEKIKQNNEIQVDSKKLESIKNNLEMEYKFIEDATTPSRVSVSALKAIKSEEEKLDSDDIVVEKVEEKDEKYIDEEIDEEAIKEAEKSRIASKFKLPKAIRQESEYTAVRKGILIHFILQNLDFSIEDKSTLKKFIDNLVDINTISKEDRKYISVSRIYNFLKSNIGRDLKDAKKIYREYEFILEDESISRSLILGVIDLFYVTNEGKVVLVDFKTDKLDNDDDFIKRYKKQLDIYKEAINELTDYKVDEVYIYSFNLNKAIKLED